MYVTQLSLSMCNYANSEVSGADTQFLYGGVDLGAHRTPRTILAN